MRRQRLGVAGVWMCGVMCVLTLGASLASAEPKCAKGEKACNDRCVPKAQVCIKVKAAAGDEAKGKDKDKVKGTPGKDEVGGERSVEDKLRGAEGTAGAVASSNPRTLEPGPPTIAGCKAHAPLEDLRRDGAEILLRASGWTFGEPKAKEGEGYRILVYEASQEGRQAVVASYWYKNPASAAQLHGRLGGQGNASAELGRDKQSVLAVILPKGQAKASAKAILEELVDCQR